MLNTLQVWARFKPVEGGRFLGCPVYHDQSEDVLCYEAEGTYLVTIRPEYQALIQFDGEEDGDAAEIFAEFILRFRGR